MIDGTPVKKVLLPPEPIELFPEESAKDKLDKIKLSSSDVESENGSDFQAYAFKTGQILEVQRAYHKVRFIHPAATHIMAACNLRSVSAYQDDGEYGASHKILADLKEQCPANVAVYVVRYHNGPKLGPKHHELIRNVAMQAVQRIGK